MTKLLTQNSKMRKSGGTKYSIWNFGIPAFQAQDGTKTCPMAGICAVGCYAQAGAYVWSNVSQAFEKRLQITKSNEFHSLMSLEISSKKIAAARKGKQLVIRIHDSGDFYSGAYTDKWLRIMDTFPDVKFYAYTKMVAMFRHIRKTRPDLPSNFTLIYSEGGRQDKLIRETSRHSRVFESVEELEAAGYDNASDDDTVAFTSESGKIGLVYHGASSKQWTTGGAA
jgi:hypothetical protein